MEYIEVEDFPHLLTARNKLAGSFLKASMFLRFLSGRKRGERAPGKSSLEISDLMDDLYRPFCFLKSEALAGQYFFIARGM